MSFKNKAIEEIVEGVPQVLIENGQIIKSVQQKELITNNELMESLLEHGCTDVSQIQLAVLGTNGKISFIQKSKD